MNKILFCWELGDDLGHLCQFYSIAHELLKRNNEVFIAVKDLSNIKNFKWDSHIKFLQAPIWLPRLRKPVKSRCYAEILIYKGYHSPSSLQALVEGWTSLFNLVKADAIIFDHSPTALLASSALGIPRLILSNPFVTPPPGTPPQNIRPWEDTDQLAIEESERYIVSVINNVAASYGFPSVNYVSDLFATEKVILSGTREIDFYRHVRGRINYIKKSTLSAAGLVEPQWGSIFTTKIFAYLKYGNEQAELMLSILASIEANVICYYAGAKKEHYDQFLSDNMHISNMPFDLTSVYNEVDVIVSHGGMGMVHSALQFGCPMILLPLQLEQQNTAYFLDKMKMAVVISSKATEEEMRKSIHQLFNSPIYFENSRLFSCSIKDTNDLVSEKDVCDEIMGLINM